MSRETDRERTTHSEEALYGIRDLINNWWHSTAGVDETVMAIKAVLLDADRLAAGSKDGSKL